MEPGGLTDNVRLTDRALNALLDVRYRDEAGQKVDANAYPRQVVAELLDAGVVTYVVGKLVLTTRGATCGMRRR